MPSHEHVIVNVFTDQTFGGNPLAVFPDARGLSGAQMQALARQFNLSETTFVLPPDNPAHTARVRIFTPAHELPFAGHPNVGTAYVLARRRTERTVELAFEEGAGIVKVRVHHDDAGAVTGARITAPHSLSLGIDLPQAVVAACAGLRPEDIRTESHPAIVASVGIGFVIAEVSGVEALARARPDTGAFRDAAEQFPDLADRLSLHLYAWQEGEARRLRARMFAPLAGIVEDPATGSANAALAALLTSLAPGDEIELGYDIEQGVEMGRPSRLFATGTKVADGGVYATVAGSCVPIMRGFVDL